MRDSRRAVEQMSHISPVAQRLRVTFGKTGPLKYTSNLDTAKIWERVLRRADLPILYTKGFNMRPRISLAMPLPLGISSECEILEISLRERIECREAELKARLLSVSPHGSNDMRDRRSGYARIHFAFAGQQRRISNQVS